MWPQKTKIAYENRWNVQAKIALHALIVLVATGIYEAVFSLISKHIARFKVWHLVLKIFGLSSMTILFSILVRNSDGRI
ncbi:MAG: hypothetical protein V3T40_02395 [Nitrososphaerales archaeon]